MVHSLLLRFIKTSAVLPLTAASVSACAHSAQITEQSLHAATGAILQADGEQARKVLSQIPASDLDDKDTTFRSCVLSRLAGEGDGETVDNATTKKTNIAARVLAAYRAYWQKSITDPAGRASAERELVFRLSSLLNLPTFPDMDAVEPLLAERLKSEGLQSLLGKTGNLRELMIWSNQTVGIEMVALPEGPNETRVVYLDGFQSLGWSRYFTCGRKGTGGWTKPDGLYLVVPGYQSLTDEKFRINFLAHESQHYSDNRRFANLPDWQLEYRAKLVELSYASQTRDNVLQGFLANQGDDPADAHSFANKKVLAALTSKLNLDSADDLFDLPIPTLQEASLEELLADSRRLEAQGFGKASE